MVMTFRYVGLAEKTWKYFLYWAQIKIIIRFITKGLFEEWVYLWLFILAFHLP